MTRAQWRTVAVTIGILLAAGSGYIADEVVTLANATPGDHITASWAALMIAQPWLTHGLVALVAFAVGLILGHIGETAKHLDP